MKTKRFILMLLVMLMSVTGAWAQQRPAANQIFYTTTDGQKIDINFDYFREGDLTSHTYENGIGIITYKYSIDKIGVEFNNKKTLQTICFGNALEYIGIEAFRECTNLKEVDLGGAVETIENSAFRYCSNLESVHNGCTVKYISQNAFSVCRKLKNIEIGESLETIGCGAFEKCNLLTEIILGESISSIDYDAFTGCPIQVFVCKAPTPPVINGDPFSFCEDFTKFIPYAHRDAYQTNATWNKWDIMPYGNLLDESVFAISTSICPALSVAKQCGANPDIQTYMNTICTTTDIKELRTSVKNCVKAIGGAIKTASAAAAYSQPTGTGMRLKVTKKDNKVYEFKTQDVESVDYYRVN